MRHGLRQRDCEQLAEAWFRLKHVCYGPRITTDTARAKQPVEHQDGRDAHCQDYAVCYTLRLTLIASPAAAGLACPGNIQPASPTSEETSTRKTRATVGLAIATLDSHHHTLLLTCHSSVALGLTWKPRITQATPKPREPSCSMSPRLLTSSSDRNRPAYPQSLCVVHPFYDTQPFPDRRSRNKDLLISNQLLKFAMQQLVSFWRYTARNCSLEVELSRVRQSRRVRCPPRAT